MHFQNFATFSSLELIVVSVNVWRYCTEIFDYLSLSALIEVTTVKYDIDNKDIYIRERGERSAREERTLIGTYFVCPRRTLPLYQHSRPSQLFRIGFR